MARARRGAGFYESFDDPDATTLIGEPEEVNQQASAIVAGRAKIVEGAVWMVRNAVRELETGDPPMRFEDARRAQFAANLMTVITSESPTTPVVNVGAPPADD